MKKQNYTSSKEALHDWAKYVDEHYMTIPKDNVTKRLDFLETVVVQGFAEIIAHLVRERADDAERQKIIWTP